MLIILLDDYGHYFYDELRYKSKDDIDISKIYTAHDSCFFTFEFMEKFGDVVLLKSKSDEYISAKELLENEIYEDDGHLYTIKNIRRPHNIRKIFMANGFNFRKGFKDRFNIDIKGVER